MAAHHRAACARRPKVGKLARRATLLRLVEEWLMELWSPEQIALRLAPSFAGDPMMWVSHETIYQSLVRPGPGLVARELRRVCAPAGPHGARRVASSGGGRWSTWS